MMTFSSPPEIAQFKNARVVFLGKSSGTFFNAACAHISLFDRLFLLLKERKCQSDLFLVPKEPKPMAQKIFLGPQISAKARDSQRDNNRDMQQQLCECKFELAFFSWPRVGRPFYLIKFAKRFFFARSVLCALCVWAEKYPIPRCVCQYSDTVTMCTGCTKKQLSLVIHTPPCGHPVKGENKEGDRKPVSYTQHTHTPSSLSMMTL